MPHGEVCTTIDSSSSTIYWGKIGTDGVTGSITVPEASYSTHEELATAINTQTLTDSDGTSHTLNVTYQQNDNTLRFHISGALSAWWISSYYSGDF